MKKICKLFLKIWKNRLATMKKKEVPSGDNFEFSSLLKNGNAHAEKIKNKKASTT